MESIQDVRELQAELARVNAELAAVRAELAKERELARIDAKTGLFNALHLKEATQAEFGRLARDQYQCPSLAMLVIDLDHFKRVNDEHGHAVGDQVLERVARIIRENVRENDIACRFGGEEIVVLMPGASQHEAANAAERLRAEIARARVNGTLSVTASIGVAAMGKEATPDALFEAADLAVYAAKKVGRNCVRIAEAN